MALSRGQPEGHAEAASSREELCRLEVEIRDPAGLAPQGNVFPVLVHLESGQSWRAIRYARRFDGFSFKGLPAGRYALRVASAHHQPVEMNLSIESGAVERVRVDLEARPPRAPLVLPLGDAAGDTPRPGDHPASRLLAGLLRDQEVLAAIESPLDSLPGIAACERHHAHRLLTIGFPPPARPLAQRLFWSIVDRRCRLEGILAAVFRNATVAELLGCTRAAVDKEARIAVDSLDRLDIADALLVLGLRAAPWKAVMGEVCRSQAGIRDVLIPVGLGNMLKPDPQAVVPARPFPRGRWNGARLDQTTLEAGPLLARLVIVIAGAWEGQVAHLTLLGPLLAEPTREFGG